MHIEYVHASRFGNGVIVAEGHVFLTAMKGPLEDGRQDKVEAFATRIPLTLESPGG